MRLNILNEYEVCINYFNDTRWEKKRLYKLQNLCE